MTTTSPEQLEILAQLEKLGGRQARHDDITFEGTKFIIPSGMTPETALHTLQEWIQNQQEDHRFHRQYLYRPYDGANATYEVLNLVYGGVMGKTTYTMFGKEPPSFVDIPIGFGETKQVPWGWVQFPLVRGKIFIGSNRDEEHGTVFTLMVECPKKFKWAVEGLFLAVGEYLLNNSIYRGKAFDGRANPNFLDLRGIDPNKIIYTDAVIQQLETNVWGSLRHTQAMRDYGLPLKRTVLLEGPYGSGKTLAAFLTAREAVTRAWTFIYCRPGEDDLHEVLTTAKLYQPAVVFAEDVEVVTAAEGAEAKNVSRFLDAFDGITVKNTEIIAILTTNHVDKIHRAMIRPGRLDAVVRIADLDAAGVERLVRASVPESHLDTNVDFDEVGTAMKGYLPAFIKEAVDRASRYAFVRTGGKPDTITTEDLCGAADGLRGQLQLMEDAPEHGARPTLEKVFTPIIEEVLGRTRVEDDAFVVDDD